MRGWASPIALLIVVALIATFALGTMVTVIETAAALHQLITNAHEGVYDDALDLCDPLDLSSCF
jgi:hypothetical protein